MTENHSILTIPSLSIPISPLPPGPPGFSVDYLWNRHKALNPLGVYVTAIKFVYGLGQQAWSSQVDLIDSGLVVVTEKPDYNVVILTSDKPPSTALTTGMVVKVLYETITDMATQAPGFYEAANFISLHDKKIGTMFIDTERLSLNNDEGVANTASPASPSHSSIPLLPITSPSNPQPTTPNQIIDPHDPRFTITYDWTGTNIPAQDIFSAAFNGLAAVALHDLTSPCEYITALSASGNAVFHIGRSSRTELFAAIIARGFYLLINRLFLVQRRFEEVFVTMRIHGVGVADGYVYKVRKGGVGNGADGVASA